jgi:tRNA1(Val) A37 N6-methylase TrmN6
VPTVRLTSALAEALNALAPAKPSRPAMVVVLRLAILAIMERESLLHPPRTGRQTRDRYARDHAILSADRNWQACGRVFRGLDRGDTRLGLPRLGSWLYSPAAVRGLKQPGARAFRGCLELVRSWASGTAAPDVFALGTAYEAMLALAAPTSPAGRKKSGSFYTPRELVNVALDAALSPVLGRGPTLPTVLDPSCGSGNFLIAAAERLAATSTRTAAASHVHGIDIDPLAAELAAFSLWRFVGKPGASWNPHRKRITVADALDARDTRTYDVVVGNPPYLNQLETSTANSRDKAAKLAKWSGGAITGYADLSSAFLLLACERCRPGGRFALVMPQSLLAARDATGVRERLLRNSRLCSLWVASRSHFAGATVLTCVPCFERGAKPEPVVLHDAETFRPAATAPHPRPDGSTWSLLAARVRGVPALESIRTSGTLGDLARATADFRDQYYGLEGFIVEDAEIDPRTRDRFPPLITSGLIDCMKSDWGRMPTRILKRVWRAPRVDRSAMQARGTLGQWITSRLVPKILLATQTRALEPLPDPEGALLPSTPVLTVTPIAIGDLWRLAAVLASPVATAIAYERTAGSAMSASAIKLAARQVLELPLPAHADSWTRAAEHLERAHAAMHSPHREELLIHAARAMNDAYGVSSPMAEPLLGWWQARALGGRAKKNPSA